VPFYRCLRVEGHSRRAYILKRVAGNELAGQVRAVNKGEVYIAPKLTNRMLIEMTRAPRAENPLDQLTERELQIFELVESTFPTSASTR